MAQHWILDERKFLSRDEQERLRREARSRRYDRARWVEWFVVELGLEAGLRVGEMSALCCGDLLVYLDRPLVFVRRGKGGKPRNVFVRDSFRRMTREFLSWKREAGEPVGADDPVFVSPMTGSALTERALQKAFKRVCEAASVHGHSIHHLRHTYASELYAASGRNLRLVQKQLGHARITTTQVYADVFDQDVDVAVNALYADVVR